MLTTLAELVWTLLLVIYYCLESTIFFFLPVSIKGKDVKGQKVLITGAGSGIGRMMAQRFAELGCELVLLDVNDTGNRETKTICEEAGARAHTYNCDVSSREKVYAVAAQIKKDVGDIDILINNAGIVTGKKLLECPDTMIQKTMDVNALAHFWMLKCFLPSMLERNHGHIVSIASIAGTTGVVRLTDYCASKFAAFGLDESLRLELDEAGKNGVHTTCVCPALIDTGLFAGTWMKFPTMFPALTPEYAANRIVDAVLSNQDVVMMPRSVYSIVAMKGFLPTKAMTEIGRFFGYDQALANFTGRQKKE